tara:strand:+ start:96 stop:410 length:315 start_codon:yes stop_codon:yes gene_type:complete
MKPNTDELFDALSLPYSGVSDLLKRTSLEAALKKHPTIGPSQRKVYEAIKGSPDGLTDKEVQILTGMSGDTERPRRLELLKADLIEESGTRMLDGRRSVVWRAK